MYLSISFEVRVDAPLPDLVPDDRLVVLGHDVAEVEAVSGGWPLMIELRPSPQRWRRGSAMTWKSLSGICGQPAPLV